MGTLSKFHRDEDVQEWLNKESCIILFSPKYDGFAIELVYHKGKLIAASTRGDGYVGEEKSYFIYMKIRRQQQTIWPTQFVLQNALSKEP